MAFNVRAIPHQSIVALSIRGAQIVLSIIVLGLSAGFLAKFNHSYDRVNFALATSILTLIYLVPLFFVPVLAFIPTGVIFAAEIIFFILWLAAFAAVADVFGSLSCSGSYYFYGYGDYDFEWCKLGKAIIGIAVINWVLFGVSLGLFVAYTLIPHSNATGWNTTLGNRNNVTTLGGIFSGVNPAVHKDLEPGVGVDGAHVAHSDEEIKPTVGGPETLGTTTSGEEVPAPAAAYIAEPAAAEPTYTTYPTEKVALDDPIHPTEPKI